VLYIDKVNIVNKYCWLKSDEDPNTGSEYTLHNISTIYLDNQIIFTNHLECIVKLST